MKESDITFLLNTPQCFDAKPTHIAHLQRMAPYYFQTPRPLSKHHLHVFGESGAKIAGAICSSKCVNLFGVVRGGIPIATSIAMALSDREMESNLFAVDKHEGLERRARLPTEPACNIVVDNAIITGATLRHVIAALERAGVRVDLVVAIFDHQVLNANGQDTIGILHSDLAVDIEFFLSFGEVMGFFKHTHQQKYSEFVSYAERYGTQALKARVNDQNREVFR